MSERELRRVEVLSRVKEGDLKLMDAAALIEVSYRQAKRLWKRYRKEGPEGLQHRSAGRESNRARPQKFREKVLRLVRQKYGGEEGKRLGPIPPCGSRAPGKRRGAEGEGGDATALDASGRVVESAAAAPTAPSAAGEKRAFW